MPKAINVTITVPIVIAVGGLLVISIPSILPDIEKETPFLYLFGGLYLVATKSSITHQELLQWSAICTCIAFVSGLALGLWALWRNYGSPVPIGTAIRVLTVCTLLAVAGRFLPEMGRVMTIAAAVLCGVAYLIGLVASGEFGPEDKARLMHVLRRKKS